ncbi:MAG TPA: hypothetical protein VL358_13545 [Caulobacteraceae bacterium]|jgi:hypothetical protein|nr:hypothetical protein [Caulobacteraceae bacterium]
MAPDRTLRRPKRPGAYAAVIALCAAILALGVAGSWSLAQHVDPMAGQRIRTR